VEQHGWQLEDLNNHDYGHLLRFANYGYLQAGIASEAAKIRQRVLQDFVASGGAAEIAAPLADIWARWVIDLEQWQQTDTLAELAREHALRQPNIWTAIGLGAVRNGNLALAQEALTVLSDLADGSASEGDIAALQVEGLIRIAEGSTQQGLSLLSDAIKINTEMNRRNPVTLIGIPPRPIKPSRELYGEALLETGNATLALQEFQTGLITYQGRTNMLLGAARAALATDNLTTARRYLRRLSETWAGAEQNHPFKNEVMQILSQ
ncbi:MAG: hypothetical protein KJN90_02155, partial [Gammaproteobacteria bacterium]|nr:hypothetical protein [Gammaproteobacteria bacterium]